MKTSSRTSFLPAIALGSVIFSFSCAAGHATSEQCDADTMELFEQNEKLGEASKSYLKTFATNCLDFKGFDPMNLSSFGASTGEEQDTSTEQATSVEYDGLCTMQAKDEDEEANEMPEDGATEKKVSMLADFEKLEGDSTYESYMNACEEVSGKFCTVTSQVSMSLGVNLGAKYNIHIDIETKDYPTCLAESCEEEDLEDSIEHDVEKFSLSTIWSSNESLRRKLADAIRGLDGEEGSFDASNLGLDQICNNPEASSESAFTCSFDITVNEAQCDGDNILQNFLDKLSSVKSAAPGFKRQFAAKVIGAASVIYLF